MQRESTSRLQQAPHGRSVPPLARLAALLTTVGARSDDVPASAVLNVQQQKQLQHELQHLLMQHLASAQQQGRAVVAPKDPASEAVEREETLAELQSKIHSMVYLLSLCSDTTVCIPSYHLSITIPISHFMYLWCRVAITSLVPPQLVYAIRLQAPCCPESRLCC